MGVDYYHILKVNRSASKEELRRAYRKLAMLWHPDKHQGDKQTAEARFKEISEAYEVLSDIEKRAIYDEYGEEGLKGIPASASQSTTPYSTPSRGHFNFQFNPRNAEDIFAEAFRNEADSEYMSHSKSTKVRTESSRRSQCQHPKAPAIERKLACSLEELFNGCTRKIKISRNVLKSNGQYVSHSEILSIDIKPGWKKGTKITFPRMGNEEPNMIPADIVFILDEKPHDMYTRAHNDLIVCLKISLGEALGGTTINLQTLDGRTLPIQLTDIVTPGHELVVPHEGMPIGRVPGSKGNLKIKFDVVFPTNLTEEQRDGIKAILGC